MKAATPLCLFAGTLLLAAPGAARAQPPVVPGDESVLYYRIGGGEPVSRPANPLSSTVRIGLGGTARVNYSCGRFDMDVTIENLMNQFANLGTTINAAVKAGIAALPLYILQRASPGLYELFQTYRRKAELEWDIALKSCEEMEAIIRQGGDPYEEWIKLAKGENWKAASLTVADVVQAKKKIETEGGTKGLAWIGGISKGGRFQGAIEVIRDLVQAGYNVTMNLPPGAPPGAVFPASGPAATRLTTTFATPRAAADWAVAVLGDVSISLCDEPGCQAKATLPGTGLLPKFEAERPAAEAQLAAVLAGVEAPRLADLEKASAPGVAVTRDLVEALQALRAPERRIAVGRVALEVAQARVIDKALLIRNLLLTGAGLPEAAYEPAREHATQRIAQLNRLIDDLLFETRVRREVLSTTAGLVLDAHRSERPLSSGTQAQERPDRRPLENGRVQ